MDGLGLHCWRSIQSQRRQQQLLLPRALRMLWKISPGKDKSMWIQVENNPRWMKAGAKQKVK
jgi:hypothetical protein